MLTGIKKSFVVLSMAVAMLGGVASVYADGRVPGFADFDARAKAGERLTICFFGGSLTWSANASDPNVTGFRGRMADYFTAKYPNAHFRFIDAAIGGTGSELGTFRLERDVLSKNPDLVFIDFICNDGGENRKLLNTIFYENLVRRIIEKGVPVVQMFFTFKFWAQHGAPYEAKDCHPRLIDYRRIAEVYSTAVGDVYRDALIPDLDSGKIDRNRNKALDKIWPLDGGHPCDFGYSYFAKAGIIGYERAVAAGAVCRVPEKPIFGEVKDVRRVNPAEASLPKGWSRRLTYRTSMWFDGLSSRWMDDVAVFAGTNATPLSVRAKGNFFGVFGEHNNNSLAFTVSSEVQPITKFWIGMGGGNLFFWRSKAFEDWKRGISTEQEFKVLPIPSNKSGAELRIGSICTATVIPCVPVGKDENVSDAALEALDHARGSVK